jgi:hypothetical protein
MKFPSIKDVASRLREINRAVSKQDEGEDDYCDIRLQVYEDGTWFVRWGDSSYDLDHRGYWGSSCVPGCGKRFNSQMVARELISQVKDMYYQSAE